MMRGIVVRQSLIDGRLPQSLPATLTRTYPYVLDGRLPVEIMEIVVLPQDAMRVALTLRRCLVPSRFYAHLVTREYMIVVFPGCVVSFARGTPHATACAQAIGIRFGIPLHQMRFSEMFENDHPDAMSARTVRGAANVAS